MCVIYVFWAPVSALWAFLPSRLSSFYCILLFYMLLILSVSTNKIYIVDRLVITRCCSVINLNRWHCFICCNDLAYSCLMLWYVILCCTLYANQYRVTVLTRWKVLWESTNPRESEICFFLSPSLSSPTIRLLLLTGDCLHFMEFFHRYFHIPLPIVTT